MSYEIVPGQILRADPHSSTYDVEVTGSSREGGHSVPCPIAGSDHGPFSLDKLAPGDRVDLLRNTTTNMITRIVGKAGLNDPINKNISPFSLMSTDWSTPPWEKGSDYNEYKTAARSGDAGLYAGFSNGSVGEFGTAYGHTLLSAFLRSSPFASVETFVQDNLLRMSGYNLSLRTSMGELIVQAAGNTATEVDEKSWFIHETLGKNSLEESQDVRSVWNIVYPDRDEQAAKEAFKALVDKAEKEKDVASRLELAHRRQLYAQYQQDHPQILPRRISMDGYLSNGKVDYVVKSTSLHVPDGQSTTNATGIRESQPEAKRFSSDIVALGNRNIPISTGLSKIKQAADGHVYISSAKGISLVKEPVITIPCSFNKDPEITEDAFEVDPVSDDPGRGTEPSDYARTAIRRDMIARNQDRRFIQAFPGIKYRNDDADSGILAAYFKFLESENIKGGTDYLPSKLEHHEYPLPPSVEMEVDKNSSAKYFCGRAGIYVTEDGGLVLQDAYGSSITLSGGNIYLNCPGDVWEMPGRDKNTWAGRNINQKAHKNLELVSSNGQARLKADKQVMVAGGLGGQQGGVLIQSKGTEPLPGTKGSEASTGGIVLKSGTHISEKAKDGIGIQAPKVSLQGQLSVTERIDTPAVYTDLLNAAGGSLNGKATYAGLAEGASTGGSPSLSWTPAVPDPQISDAVDAEVVAQSGFIATDTDFTFNTSEEYGYTDGYNLILPEAVWQTRDRLAETARFWAEPDGDTYGMPHPGKEMWEKAMIRRPAEASDEFTLNPDADKMYKFETVPAAGNVVIN